MLDAGISTFVELSPNPVLSSMVLQCAAAFPGSVQLLPSLRQGQPELLHMLKSLSALFVAGADIDWRAVHPKGGGLFNCHCIRGKGNGSGWIWPPSEPEARSIKQRYQTTGFTRLTGRKCRGADEAFVRAAPLRLASPEVLEAGAQSSSRCP